MKLSVAMFTYNHEAYIAQALDSALMQQAGFDYEIVVGDDGSDDGTRAILAAYQSRHPDRLRLLLHPRRVGVGRNVHEVLTACRGEYVALLDGDDYWTSPDKLRRQVGFLDAHPEYTVSCHPVRMYEQDAGAFKGVWGENPEPLRTWTLEDIFEGRYYPKTSSIVYRASCFGVPAWIAEVLNCDFVIITLCGDRGSFGDLGPEAMSVYRIHTRGVWSTTDGLAQLTQTVNTRRCLNRHLDSKYAPALRVRFQMVELARHQMRAGNRSGARRTFLEATLARGEGPLAPRTWLAGFVDVFLPFIGRPLRSLDPRARRSA